MEKGDNEYNVPTYYTGLCWVYLLRDHLQSFMESNKNLVCYTLTDLVQLPNIYDHMGLFFNIVCGPGPSASILGLLSRKSRRQAKKILPDLP